MTKRTQFDRDMEIQGSLATDIQSIFRTARREFWNHAGILDALRRRIHDNPRHVKLPQWRKSYLQGAASALFDMLYDTDLEWRVSLDGQLILGKDVPEGRWADVDCEAGRRVWIKDPSKIY